MTTDNPNGKGDLQRPYSVSKEVYALRYTLVWGSDKDKQRARMKLIEMGEIKDDKG